MTRHFTVFFPRTRTVTDVPADVSSSKCLIFFTRRKKFKLKKLMFSKDQVVEENCHLTKYLFFIFPSYSGNFLSLVFKVVSVLINQIMAAA